ncbi:hypothetical protein BDV96DRAFT_656276 [Lophiotrema nucula]|uniref:Uncharacterized protein n=1 Tax=Lophiotrema nucula TaxID=690887 RepID=A0A6A5ZSH4_9PLEO|nr:hypothetical protein BDV96DRAFT_656276 [Lophiotrema nucula]
MADPDIARHGFLTDTMHQAGNGIVASIFYLESLFSYSGWFVPRVKPLDVTIPSVKPMLPFTKRVKDSSNPTSLLYSINVGSDQCPRQQFMDFYDAPKDADAPKEEDVFSKAAIISARALDRVKMFTLSMLGQIQTSATRGEAQIKPVVWSVLEEVNTYIEPLCKSTFCQPEQLAHYACMLFLFLAIFFSCQYLLPDGAPAPERVLSEKEKEEEQAKFMTTYNERYEAFKAKLEAQKTRKGDPNANNKNKALEQDNEHPESQNEQRDSEKQDLKADLQNLKADMQKLKADMQRKEDNFAAREDALGKVINEVKKSIAALAEAKGTDIAELKKGVATLTDNSLSPDAFKAVRAMISLFPFLMDSLADTQSRVKVLETANADTLGHVSTLQEHSLSLDEVKVVRSLIARAAYLMESVADTQSRVKSLESDNADLLSHASVTDDIFVAFANAFWMATFRDDPVNRGFTQAKHAIKDNAGALTVADLLKLLPEFLSRLLAVVNRQTDVADAALKFRGQLSTLSGQVAGLQSRSSFQQPVGLPQYGNGGQASPMTPPRQYYNGAMFHNGFPPAYSNGSGYGNGNGSPFGGPQR